VEIRAGEGGTDSKLFVHDLFAAYVKYAASRGLKAELLDSSDGSATGRFWGHSAGSAFAFESGKHVVQRVPPTERNGRWQTSVVAVAVMPMPPRHELRLLPESELEVSTLRGSGPGGQHRNKTESAVRIVHKPTRLQVFLDGGRSQHQNRAEAHRILSAKVAQHYGEQIQATYDAKRKAQVDGGGRGNKIRTYNFIKCRAVDHRTGKKTRDVQAVIEKGRFDLLI